jgi:ABC-2 type transport system permease protein
VLALARRDALIQASYRVVLVLDLTLGVLDLLVYYFISKALSGPSHASLAPAPSYFAFALVGIALTVVVSAASLGIATTVREEQLTGTLEALVTQPVTAVEMGLGLCGLPFGFATIRVALYLLVGGALLGIDFSHTDWLGLVTILVTTAAAMSAVGIATAAAVLVVKRGQTLAGLVIFGMSLAGGAFFPVSVLPGWLEAIGKVVPPRFAFDGLRNALYRGGGWETDAAVLAAFAVVTLPLGLWLFARGLRYARRSGSLAQY